MPELTTHLGVSECADMLKVGIEEGRGFGSQIGGMVAKMRGGEDLGYYTPEAYDSPFAALDGDPHDFTVGVAIPRLNKAHAHGTNVHMTVWDRNTHRDVVLWAHFAVFGVAHAAGVLSRIEGRLAPIEQPDLTSSETPEPNNLLNPMAVPTPAGATTSSAALLQQAPSAEASSGDYSLPTIRPATWEDIRTGLLHAYESVEGVTVDASDPTFLAFKLVDSAGQRSQNVMIILTEGMHGPDWIRIESGFAAYSQEAAIYAIDFVSKPENSGMGVARSGNYLQLRWTAAVGSISMNEVFTMVDAVAGYADKLESQISEDDAF